jgi:DNA helicase IV
LPPQPDLERRETAAEQAVVDRVYDQLDRATRSAQALAREGHGRARLGHEGGLVERDAMVFQAAKRIATLDAAHEGLVFGRLDLKDPTEDPRYIGRIGLRDDDHESLLVDWRAPAAAVFYQADRPRRRGRPPRPWRGGGPPGGRRGRPPRPALPCT